ncbi:MAG TPA: DRTGG domain-containing protein [Dehalococcoidia bacterium]|nr:DRTGG domain-containing protein [Dehalococcoidia bacterium]
MPALQILSTQPFSGKTTIAVAVARGLAEGGAAIRLVRAGSDEAALEDALTFASYLWAGSAGQPDAKIPSAARGETLVVELDAGAEPDAKLPALIAVRGVPTDADRALAASLGDRLVGTIAICVNPTAIEDVARELTNGNLRPLALIPEDRLLSAPSVAEIGASLGARTLYAGENEREVVEDVLIGPVYADPARPHFRRFASKAILAPFNKTDLHLAAIETNAACLVITGGKEPSPYVLDRVQGEATTILLSDKDTPGTVASLAGVWSHSRFRGERKSDAAYAYLQGRVDFASLARKL